MNQLKHIVGILLFLLGLLITCRRDSISPDTPPIAKAGSDQTILLPNDTAILSGVGSGDADDSRDKVTEYYWRKISGPRSSQIDTPSAKTTIVILLEVGIYNFELKVTDVQGLSSTDTMRVTVIASSFAPISNAGPDTSILVIFDSCHYQPSSAELDGTGSFDPYHTPLTYLWTQVKGYSAQIISPSTAKTNINGLLPGDYEFELLVSDAVGKSSRDTVRIKAERSGPSAPPYELNISLNTNYSFQDNYEDCNIYDCSYYDLASFSGEGIIPPLGDFHIYMIENSDSSNLADGHSTILEIHNGNGNYKYINGNCSINFKRLIVNGGGPFTGNYTITQGSAIDCEPNIVNSLSPLSISGTINTSTKSITMTISGKVYF